MLNLYARTGDYLDLSKSDPSLFPPDFFIEISESNLSDHEIQDLLSEVLLIEVHNDGKNAKVLFHVNAKPIYKIVPIALATDIIREYKVINIQENYDNNRGEEIYVMDLSPIIRHFSSMGNGLSWFNIFNSDDIDTFIIDVNSNLGEDIMNNPHENPFLRLSEFTKGMIFLKKNLRTVYSYVHNNYWAPLEKINYTVIYDIDEDYNSEN